MLRYFFFDACRRFIYCTYIYPKISNGVCLYKFFIAFFYPLHTSKFYYIHKMGSTNVGFLGLSTVFNEVEILKCLNVLKRIYNAGKTTSIIGMWENLRKFCIKVRFDGVVCFHVIC